VGVFPAEIEAGLEKAVRACASAMLTAAAEPVSPGDTRSTAGDLSLPDLYELRSVLVSTGLNRNDDWFDSSETYAARHTPVDKPFNLEHVPGDVIGHMTAASVVAADGSEVPEGSDPPASFHVVNGAVLYRHWPGDEARQSRMDRIIAEIDDPPAEGGWCVSMECRFKGFDYVLVPRDGAALATDRARVVARTEKTAFLTKHLRAYGGSGTYQGQAVGRVLRNITFSGVGLVRNPANPASVILPPESDKSEARFEPPSAQAVYEPHNESQESTMNEVETLKQQLAEARADLKAAEDRLAEAAKANFEKQLADAVAAREAAEAALQAAKAELDAARAAMAAAEAAKAELAARLDAVTAEAAAAAEAAKAADRASRVKAAYGFESDDEAKATAETLKALADEAFDKHLATIAEYKTKLTGLPAGETKLTDKPAPMGGGAKKVETVKAAIAGDPEPEPALNVATAAADEAERQLADEVLAYWGRGQAATADDGEPAKPKAKKSKAK
jgi:hypothetical protein